jgi:hypothetical protein
MIDSAEQSNDETLKDATDGFTLRIIAMFTMLLDHIGWKFLPEPMFLTWIGRIAFPLYAFLLADGLLFVKDNARRLTHHVAVLLVLALVSEPCFDLMEHGFDFARYMDFQSNMITLLLGYLALIATDAFAPDGRALPSGRQTTEHDRAHRLLSHRLRHQLRGQGEL